MRELLVLFCFFFFNDTATTEIYTLSLHDALPICDPDRPDARQRRHRRRPAGRLRSEEHTSELQSLAYLVCRLLLEKKKNVTRPRPWLQHAATAQAGCHRTKIP